MAVDDKELEDFMPDTELEWSDTAVARMKNVPFFVRKSVRIDLHGEHQSVLAYFPGTAILSIGDAFKAICRGSTFEGHGRVITIKRTIIIKIYLIWTIAFIL